MDAALQTLNHPFQQSPDHTLPADIVPESTALYRWTLRLLCGTGLCVTGYLAWVALNSGDVAGCGSGPVWNCGHVLSSRWSKLFGLPVSVPAFFLYGVLLSALAICRPTAPRAIRRLAWGAISMCALAAGFAALWFVGLQTLAIGHLCIYCLVAHSCGIALSAAILWKRPLGTRATMRLATVSLVGVSVLIGGQLMATPPATFKIERFADVSETEEMAAPTATLSQSEIPGKSADIEIFEPF
jgi:uncharacterized membrane protein